MSENLGQALDNAARVILSSRYTVALVGAGISVESGIPPFRGPGGLWTRFGEPDMRGYERFLADPKGWWEARLRPEGYQGEFRDAIERAQPNAGHYALAELETLGLLGCIITQNVDNLHQAAGSHRVAEIHGNRFKLRCIACNARFEMDELPLDELPPQCPRCSGIVKGDGVMFGEPIPSDVLRWCQEETYRCDCFMLVGTSAVVYPAAAFPLTAKSQGAALIEINPMETALSRQCDVILRGPSGQLLPLLVARLKELRV